MEEDARQRMIRYLQDAHAAEVDIKDLLRGFIEDTDDADIKSVYEQHLQVTHSQVHRLESRIRAYDETPNGVTGFFHSLLGKVSELIHGAHDEFDRNTQNLVKAYATEHLERGMYESLIAYANAIGDQETAKVAKQIQLEEEQAAQTIWPLIGQYAQTSLAGTVGISAATAEISHPGNAFPL